MTTAQAHSSKKLSCTLKLRKPSRGFRRAFTTRGLIPDVTRLVTPTIRPEVATLCLDTEEMLCLLIPQRCPSLRAGDIKISRCLRESIRPTSRPCIHLENVLALA